MTSPRRWADLTPNEQAEVYAYLDEKEGGYICVGCGAGVTAHGARLGHFCQPKPLYQCNACGGWHRPEKLALCKG